MWTFKTVTLFLPALATALLGCATAPSPGAPADPSSTAVAAAGDLQSTSAPVFAVLTKADWCSICQANGERVTAVLKKGVQDGSYELVVNDITTDETTESSRAVLASKGLVDVASGAAPGSIVFVDPQTRKLVAGATVAHKNEEIAALTELAHKRVNRR